MNGEETRLTFLVGWPGCRLPSLIAADAGVAYVRAVMRSEVDATGRTSLAGCRRGIRAACEPEAKLSLASERASDDVDMLIVSNACVSKMMLLDNDDRGDDQMARERERVVVCVGRVLLANFFQPSACCANRAALFHRSMPSARFTLYLLSRGNTRHFALYEALSVPVFFLSRICSV